MLEIYLMNLLETTEFVLLLLIIVTSVLLGSYFVSLFSDDKVSENVRRITSKKIPFVSISLVVTIALFILMPPSEVREIVKEQAYIKLSNEERNE